METFTFVLESLTYWLVDQYWFPVFLIGSGIFFTIYLGFPQIKYFKHGWRILSGRYVKEDTQGETTPFQALTTALSGTVGTGNIGGVALAIFLGGPAAIFWMWITAFFGMTTKFVEVTLAHKYREVLPDGSISGGPMYYIENGLNMKWLAILFSICLLLMCLGTGNMPQISSIAVIMNDTFHIPKFVTGAVLAVLLWMVIIGGIKRIAQIASKLVPFMAFWYLVGSFAVIISNYENIIPSLQSIFVHVFTPAAAVGGFLGASVAAALTRGVNRGLYSNEAGQGSAPIAHASSKTENPIEEGMVSILEPFIDTIIICTITGLVILSSGVWTEKFENRFEESSMCYLEGSYSDQNQDDIAILQNYILSCSGAETFTGKEEIKDGKKYQVATLKKLVLIPQRSGNLPIEGMELNVPVAIQTNTRDFFGRPRSRMINIICATNDKNLRVKELPIDGKPFDFSGAVGTFEFTTKLDRDSIEANESASLSMRISGTGNLRMIELPKFDIPNDIEAYEPKYKENIKHKLSMALKKKWCPHPNLFGIELKKKIK